MACMYRRPPRGLVAIYSSPRVMVSPSSVVQEQPTLVVAARGWRGGAGVMNTMQPSGMSTH